MRLNDSVKNDRQELQVHHFRLSLLVALLVILSFILILRLAYLQFSQFKRYATLSLKNQMSIIPIAPPRGIILDKNGVILADNIPVYVLEIIPERVTNLTATLAKLKQLIPSITDEDIDNFNHARSQNRSYVPIPLKLKLTEEEVAIFASNQYLFPGISIKARLMRYYPLGAPVAHLLGYVGRINVQELQQVDNTNYRATNFIGKSGIERYYENTLHGRVGYQQVETDVSGRTLRVLSKQAPVSGAKIYLTIDARLQEAVYNALEGKRGAAVVMSVKDGDILAMVSTPSFDPNLFVNGISNKDYQQLANTQDKPLYNRAVRGLYPPASTVKPFVALAGLEKGTITPSTKIYDPGWYGLPGVSHKYRDWKRHGHGIINLKRAITVSCDTYFYQLGNKLGISAIEDFLMQFGFGQLSHVDLFEEAPGIVPGPSWKRRSRGASWYPGDTLITSIGQGFMLASPLQLANATAALSMHGRRFRPHLFGRSVEDDGKVHPYKPLEEYPIQLKDNVHWTIITEAMQNVINSPEGTGHRFGRNSAYTVAGKTGTAQVFSGNQYEKKSYQEIPEALRDHSLFIAFAPVENPEIAVSVLVENDFIASIVARKIMDAYFDLNQKNPET
ncbi:penicillin-binding protein 2 [Legionella oakridgensis]|uniref:Peptidoglycan D,D-transpeptidase MrdA n=2 Tax=Legionella oakridgensis TaxID=29423 RepID=W0B7Z2_9GAMM|nr:penicillin-binding protein 2 [Legionella oakridgensis]AHE66663.1 penicillin-binding protein 2 [Legionella oakridgensis ATCC 33761 = DSM 21215]ETO93628.1 peptidoglycan glycosyltransferase [Legionella oakridgensis RV-2-2007]KTD37746.1 penicillin-binding protein 2 [Legionella oakridgensis]STY19802.1 penicillin-binding protein 2 [Legionella longbeachae]